MKKILLASLITLVLTGCLDKGIPNGYIGVEQTHNSAGSVVTTNKISNNTVLIPTFAKTYLFEQPFVSRTENVDIEFQISCTYQFEVDKIPLFYAQYMATVDTFIEKTVKPVISKFLIIETGKFTINDLQAGYMENVLINVTDKVNEHFNSVGFKLLDISLTQNFTFQQEIRNTINRLVATKYEKEAAELEYAREQILIDMGHAQTLQEIDKAIQWANAEAERTVIKAEAKAKEIKLLGEAVAQNPAYLDLLGKSEPELPDPNIIE